MGDSGAGWLDGRLIVVILVILLSTILYGIGLWIKGSIPVEPQSVFTLYGTILGYLFGSHEKRRDQSVEVAKKELGG